MPNGTTRAEIHLGGSGCNADTSLKFLLRKRRRKHLSTVGWDGEARVHRGKQAFGFKKWNITYTKSNLKWYERLPKRSTYFLRCCCKLRKIPNCIWAAGKCSWNERLDRRIEKHIKALQLKVIFIRDRTTETDTTEHSIPLANGRVMTAEVTNNNTY